MSTHALKALRYESDRSASDEVAKLLSLRNEHVGEDRVADGGLPRNWSRPRLTRLRFQVPLVIAATAFLPGLILRIPDFWEISSWSSASNSFVLVCGCALVALLLFRRLEQFPGISSFAQIAPSVLAGYGLLLATVFVLRLNYSRPFILISAFTCLSLLGGLWFYYRRWSRPTVYLLPDTPEIESTRLRLNRLARPTTELQPNSIVAADLRLELAPNWQRFILNAALAGIPVFDVRALQESITGKVQISHLSENTFGSVLPSLPYQRVKRILDFSFAILALPLVACAICLIAFAIKMDDRGEVFFTQQRIGFRGRPFMMVKFRTMRAADQIADCEIESSMTKDGDVRITRVGQFLRRHRIDELPQVLNILKGEMSWIGPRPEARPLAQFYETQIPFYGYRHVVRPGLAGWAQVNQGHVVEVDAIRDKLNYDFFYIKNFSAWLDVLIAVRTVRILLFGAGAR